MYDPYDISELAPRGYVTVRAAGAYHECVFKYDFTLDEQFTLQSKDRKMKKFYNIKHLPIYRIYGQDEHFSFNKAVLK